MKKDDDKDEATISISDQQKIDEKTRSSLFSSRGQNLKCQFCDSDIITLIEYHNTVLGYILCAISVLLFGVYGIAISLFIFPLCRSANHRCPKCYNLVISSSFLGIPSLQDQVITFNIGTCAVILTRKILLVLFVTCAAIALLIVVLKHKIAYLPAFESTISPLTWEEYRANCGVLAFLADPKSVLKKFKKDYQYLNVHWSGYIAKITVNTNNHADTHGHACVIFVKMHPDDFENAISLALTLDEELYDASKPELANVKMGDKMEFKATIIGIGSDRNLGHLHGLSLKLLNEHMELPQSMTCYGRYGPMGN